MAFSGSPCLAFSNSLCSEHSGLMVSLSACLSPRSSIPDQSLAAPSYLGDGHSGYISQQCHKIWGDREKAGTHITPKS